MLCVCVCVCVDSRLGAGSCLSMISEITVITTNDTHLSTLSHWGSPSPHTHTHTHTLAHTHSRTRPRAHTLVHTHTRAHTHMRTHTHTFSPLSPQCKRYQE